MIPTTRLALLLFIVAAIAVAEPFVPEIAWVVYVVDAIAVGLVLIDALLLWGRRISVERTAPEVFSVGRDHAIVLRLRNHRGRILRCLVGDDPVAECTSDGLPASVALPPHGEALVPYVLLPTRRGRREFGSVAVRYGSPLGFLTRQERIATPGEFDVYPDVHAARALELLRRQGRGDARMGSLRVRGGETEFERLRTYQVGDEPRFIDWRATARRNEVTVRQFQTESNQNIIFAIDTGRGMRGETEGLSHMDRALNASLLAADVALRTGDRAGLLVFDESPTRFLKPVGGKSGGQRLIRAAYEVDAGLKSTDYRAAIAFLRTQIRARSLIILFTQVLDPRSASELTSSLRSLLPLHLPLVVLLRENDLEDRVLEPVYGEQDLYDRAAAAEVLAWRDGLIRKLRRNGTLVLDVRASDMTPELVKQYLEVKARSLL